MDNPKPRRRTRIIIFALIVIALGLGLALGYKHFSDARAWRQYHGPLPEPARTMALTMPEQPVPGDWPQWRGPNRDGVSTATGLLQDWPAAGPKLLWTFDAAGIGYSAPAVVGAKVFILGARGDAEYVHVLDAQTGKQLGEAIIGHRLKNNWGDGPRGTPTIDGTRLYAIGGIGDLACVELATGAVLWRKNIYHDLGSRLPYWGCGESPLIDGDMLLCTPGEGQGAVAALNKLSGEPLWRSSGFTDNTAYSSLVIGEAGGVRQYVQMTFQSVAGVAADDGRLLWRFPRDGREAPIPTPIVRDNFVYVTSGYAVGCNLLELSVNGGSFNCRDVYANKIMTTLHGGVVLVGEHLYGYSDNKGWMCQDFHTGKEVWSEKRKLGKGSLIYADGRLYCYTENDGTLCLVEASPKGWKEHGRLTIPRQTTNPRKEGKIWTHPVIAEGKLWLRDQELLFCYDVKGQ
jgi:outer membrane protein assembly factor BamB